MRRVWMMALLGLPGCSRPLEQPEIREVLDRQVAAWNRGDVEGFMQGYWKSDNLEFATPQETTRGWQATLDRYRKRYSTPAKMGHLRFEKLAAVEMRPDFARVSGRYLLDTSEGAKSGRFELTFRRMDGAWVITRDHTVADP